MDCGWKKNCPLPQELCWPTFGVRAQRQSNPPPPLQTEVGDGTYLLMMDVLYGAYPLSGGLARLESILSAPTHNRELRAVIC